MVNGNKEKTVAFIVAVSVFCIYFFVAMHELLHASLWFDETIEYYYSKYMFGTVPGGRDTINMYERIISTFQPPLYNFVMFIWLQINDSEFWFRLSGVIFGFFGAIGLSKAIAKITNYKYAMAGVLIYTFSYRIIYYVQECAEYNLMLCFVGWLLYYFIWVLDDPSLKNICLYTLFGILAVYTQYGSAILVMGCSLGIYIYLIWNKQREAIIKLSKVFFVTVIVAVVPLYYFFLRLQIGGSNDEMIILSMFDMIVSFIKMLNWNLISIKETMIGMMFLGIATAGFFVISILLFLKSKSKRHKVVLLTGILIWLIYYFLVKLGLYRSGYTDEFGNRYGLFFAPYLILMLMVSIAEVLKYNKNIKEGKIDLKKINSLLAVFCLISYCFFGWGNLEHNWYKEDIRGVTEQWYSNEAYKNDTLVYYAAESGFSYYLEKNEKYQEKFKKNIIFQEWMRGLTELEYREYFQTIYSEGIPSELYICAAHYQDDLLTMLQVFQNEGYIIQDLYNEHGGWLLYLKREYK